MHRWDGPATRAAELRACWNLLFHNSGYPRVSKWTDLPMLGLSPGPFLYRASDGLDGGGHTPAGQTDGHGQAERQRTAMPRRQGDGRVRYEV